VNLNPWSGAGIGSGLQPTRNRPLLSLTLILWGLGKDEENPKNWSNGEGVTSSIFLQHARQAQAEPGGNAEHLFRRIGHCRFDVRLWCFSLEQTRSA
jgi:hypothetical protein